MLDAAKLALAQRAHRILCRCDEVFQRRAGPIEPRLRVGLELREGTIGRIFGCARRSLGEENVM